MLICYANMSQEVSEMRVGCFDARGTRANHDADEVVIKFPANELRDISFYLQYLRNV